MYYIGLAILALIFINLIISCISIFLHIKNNKKETKYVESKDAVVTQIEQREGQQLVDDMELLLVIATTIATYEGKSTSDFVVRSIIRR